MAILSLTTPLIKSTLFMVNPERLDKFYVIPHHHHSLKNFGSQQ